MIRTPDQRLRVFISSTIQELAEERIAAKKAIEELRLTPVLFEIGARPYPPRDLYRAYLDQSDIFIGIYWKSYGWIAPDMDISGLEDEYLLSFAKPRLIYINKSNERQERLKTLIDDMGQSGISYKTFIDPSELKDLVGNDLAQILSEQFYKESMQVGQQQEPLFNNVPFPDNHLIGRDVEMQEITSRLYNETTRLTTILGMGGTGKTRLAIEIGQQAMSHFRHGVVFVNLAVLKDPAQLASVIAQQLGLADSSRQSVTEILLSFLSDKHLLLILDNFEQLTDGAPLLSDIIHRSKQVSILVTSRKPLYLRTEFVYPLLPLALPQASVHGDAKHMMEAPAVSLFIDRLRSVNPRLVLDDENIVAISILCEKLGGLPLAIELAAMRTRYFTPVALLKGMTRTLDILKTSTRDMPDRHQSFRATVDWSYNLLSEEEKTVFRFTSIFRNGCSLQAIAATNSLPDSKCAEIIEQLLDAGLIRFHPDDHGNMRYDMLRPIAEFAEELLTVDPIKPAAERRYVEYFENIVAHLKHFRLTAEEHDTLCFYADSEYENFRNAYGLALSQGRPDIARAIILPMSIVWFRRGQQNEGLRLMDEIGIARPSDWKVLPQDVIWQHAMLLLIAGSFRFLPFDFRGAMRDLEAAREMFEYIQQYDGVSRSYAYMCLVAHTTGDPEAMHYATESINFGKQSGDIHSVLASSVLATELYAVSGDMDAALETITTAEYLLKTNPFHTAYALGLGDSGAIVYLEKGHMYFAAKEFNTAKTAYTESVHRFENAGMRSSRGYALSGLAAIAILEGKPDEAKRYGITALNDARESGDNIVGLFTIRVLAAYLLWNGRIDEGIRFLTEVESQLKQLNYSPWCVDVHINGHISIKLEEFQMKYPEAEEKAGMSFDELVREVMEEV